MFGVVEPGPRQPQSSAHSPGAKRHLRATRAKGQRRAGLAQIHRDTGSNAKAAEEAEGHGSSLNLSYAFDYSDM